MKVKYRKNFFILKNFQKNNHFRSLSASVNPNGSNCPPALRLIACLVLYEITAFLRETYQTLPKTSKLSTKEKPPPWDKVHREANRRWSMALSSMGHSQTSAQSLQSIAGDNERKISFVLHEPDNDSENSSNTTVTMQGEESNNAPVASSECFIEKNRKWQCLKDAYLSGIQQRRPMANVRPFLLRRGTNAQAPAGGSFKRRSLKLRRGTKESKDLETDCRCTFACFHIEISVQILNSSVFSATNRFDSISKKSFIDI